MDNKTNAGLGLDMLKAQMTKGPKPIEIKPVDPVPPVDPVDPASKKPPVVDPDDKTVDPLKKPIDVSNATSVEPIKPENPSPEDIQDASLFAPFANVLKEKGILSDDIIEGIDLNSTEGFTQAIQKRIDAEVSAHTNQYMSNRSEDAKLFIDMLDKGVPLDTAKQVVQNQVSVKDFTEEKLGDVSLQKKAVSMYLQSLNMDETEIKEQIEYFEDTNKLEQKAFGFAQKLQAAAEQEAANKVAQAEANKTAMIEAQQKQLADLKDTIFKTAEIVPGKKLNDAIKDKLFTSMTTPVGKDEYGNPINSVMQKRNADPVSFELKLHYLNELGIFDDKWDGITNSVKTDAVADFEKALSTTKPINGKSPVISPEAQKSTKDLADSIKMIKSQLNK